MKYKAICFDVDGTLYPTSFEKKVEASMGFFHPVVGKYYSQTRVALRKHQKDFGKYGLEDKSFGYKEAAVLTFVSKKFKSVEKAREYLDKRFYRVLAKHYSKLPYQPNTVELFKKLKEKGYMIGIMTDWPLGTKLERIGVEKYCDFKCDPDGMGYLKPNPHTFEYLLYNLKLDASQVLYVGDSYEKDIEGAYGAGVDAVLVNREDNGKYPKALKVFKDLKEFTKWMEEN